MTDSPEVQADSTRRNRLTIAHLLLWTATTAVVLTYMQAHPPPPPEKLGLASILVQPGGPTADVQIATMRRRFSKQLQIQHYIGLAFAPFYGAALAGVVLALWRTARWKYGFPSQAGHWLLLLIGSLTLLVAARQPLRNRMDWQDGPDFVIATILTAMFTAVTAIVRKPVWWRYSIGLAAVGLVFLIIASVVDYLSAAIVPSPLFAVGLLALAGSFIAALLCAIHDITTRQRYDALHWVGVAALLGFVAHLLALLAAARWFA